MFETSMPFYAKCGIYAHAVLGSVALIAGGVAAAAKKGGHLHRSSGKAFFVAMLAAIAAAIPAIVARRNVFLALLAPFAVNLLLRGWLVAQARLRRHPANGKLAWSVLGLSASSSIGMLAVGVYWLTHGASVVGFGGVCLGLGTLGLRVAARDLVSLRSIEPAPLSDHISGMLGAYTAAVTAFTAVNLHQDVFPPVLVWLIPPAVGVVAIRRCTKRLGRARSSLPTEPGDPGRLAQPDAEVQSSR
jgi:hypothetical protein